MSSKYLVLAAALLAGAMLVPQLSHAGALTPPKPPVVAESGSLMQVVHWGPRCRFWRHECADRWGWGTWRWRRCLRWHGCW